MLNNIQLPNPRLTSTVSLEAAIAQRRSVRTFSQRELTMEQLGQLLWAGQGITEREKGFRAAPSAGALFPLSLYILTKEGFYLYLPASHELQQLSSEDHRTALAQAALRQGSIQEAPLVIVIAGNHERTGAKYDSRAFRYIYQEVGHVAENIHLQAVALGMASVPIGAFQDDKVQRVLSLPHRQAPLYIIPVGYPVTGGKNGNQHS